MSRLSWDEFGLGVAELAARRSLCKPGAGACAISADHRTVVPGYAGPSEYVDTFGCDDCTSYCRRHLKPVADRDPGYRDCPSVHAEMNLLMQADRSRIQDGTIYINRAPCYQCRKMIANSGLKRMVYATGSDEHKSEYVPEMTA